MNEMEQEKRLSLNADKSLRRALDIQKAKDNVKKKCRFSVDIDLKNGDNIRGKDVEFFYLKDAKKLFDKVSESGEHNGYKIDNVQLLSIGIKSYYDVLESKFFDV